MPSTKLHHRESIVSYSLVKENTEISYYTRKAWTSLQRTTGYRVIKSNLMMKMSFSLQYCCDWMWEKQELREIWSKDFHAISYEISLMYFQSTKAIVFHNKVELSEHHFSTTIYGLERIVIANMVIIYGYKPWSKYNQIVACSIRSSITMSFIHLAQWCGLCIVHH